MIRSWSVTVLAENTAGARGLLAEHGLSLWIEADGHRILFDTGQGLVLTANAKALDVDLATADAVVLSHGHYDHAGGLAQILDQTARAGLYVHPLALGHKFGRRSDGTKSEIGSPVRSVDEVRPRFARVALTEGPTELAGGVWVTGEIPRCHTFEQADSWFFLDEACTTPDPLVDDQAMYLETAQGTVIFVGCAHAGLVNTLDYVSKLTGGRPIHALIGGFHLVGAPEEQIHDTLDALGRHNVQRVAPGHCTGLPATAQILTAFPHRFLILHTGTRLTTA